MHSCRKRWLTQKAQYICGKPLPPAPLASSFAGIGPADLYTRQPQEIAAISGGSVRRGRRSSCQGRLRPIVVFFQLVPWQINYEKTYDVKPTYRHVSFALSRLLGNLGVRGETSASGQSPRACALAGWVLGERGPWCKVRRTQGRLAQDSRRQGVA